MDQISYPNQKHICINKDKYNKAFIYAIYKQDALKTAMKDLTPKAFIMWCYLAKNTDGFEFWLSKADFFNWTNLSESSYRRAIEELIDKHYLIKKNKNKEYYDFYEYPKNKTELESMHITIHKDDDFMF